MKSCDEVLELIAEGPVPSLPAAGQAEIGEHLASCAACEAFLRTQDEVAPLVRAALAVEVDAALQAELDAAVMAAWRRRA